MQIISSDEWSNTFMNNSKPIQSTPQNVESTPSLSPGLTNAMLSNIGNIILQWGEAAGPFLTIEPFMRLIAELNAPFRDKIGELIKNAKPKPKFKNYWDCDPIYLTNAIDVRFGQNMEVEARKQILKFPSIRGKFLHGNLIGLMEILQIEPTGRVMSSQMGQPKRKRLEPGEIKESFLSMERNQVFAVLCQYSANVRKTLQEIIRGLAK
jgi:hypothetical protein